MKTKEFIKHLEKYDDEKELRFDFINLGLKGDTAEFRTREWANCIDILPILPKGSDKNED